MELLTARRKSYALLWSAPRSADSKRVTIHGSVCFDGKAGERHIAKGTYVSRWADPAGDLVLTAETQLTERRFGR